MRIFSRVRSGAVTSTASAVAGFLVWAANVVDCRTQYAVAAVAQLRAAALLQRGTVQSIVPFLLDVLPVPIRPATSGFLPAVEECLAGDAGREMVRETAKQNAGLIVETAASQCAYRQPASADAAVQEPVRAAQLPLTVVVRNNGVPSIHFSAKCTGHQGSEITLVLRIDVTGGDADSFLWPEIVDLTERLRVETQRAAGGENSGVFLQVERGLQRASGDQGTLSFHLVFPDVLTGSSLMKDRAIPGEGHNWNRILQRASPTALGERAIFLVEEAGRAMNDLAAAAGAANAAAAAAVAAALPRLSALLGEVHTLAALEAAAALFAAADAAVAPSPALTRAAEFQRALLTYIGGAGAKFTLHAAADNRQLAAPRAVKATVASGAADAVCELLSLDANFATQGKRMNVVGVHNTGADGTGAAVVVCQLQTEDMSQFITFQSEETSNAIALSLGHFIAFRQITSVGTLRHDLVQFFPPRLYSLTNPTLQLVARFPDREPVATLYQLGLATHPDAE